MTELLGVTGATGAVGGRVAELLAGRDVARRLIVRAGSEVRDARGAEVAEIADYGDFASVRSACEGVTSLFLVSGREHPERLRQHRTAVDAAVDAGVERIVYLSFLGAAPDATFTLARQHHATEQHVRASGVAFTFLRSSLYLDFVPWIASSAGVIAGPAGDGRVAPVARADVAETVAAVLTSRAHDGMTYDNTGPEAFTLADAAAELSRVIGREVRYVDETLEQAWESRRSLGAPDWEIEGWITSYVAIANGEMDVVSDTVERLTGHPPRSLREYLAAHPESYAHLTGD